MHTYQEHVRFLQRELEGLGKPFGLALLPLLRVMGAAPSLEADVACRVFAATLQWPPLTDATRLEVGLRLLCAIEWCEERIPVDGDCSENGSDFLAQVLIDYWQDFERGHWLAGYLTKPR